MLLFDKYQSDYGDTRLRVAESWGLDHNTYHRSGAGIKIRLNGVLLNAVLDFHLFPCLFTLPRGIHTRRRFAIMLTSFSLMSF
jgi:hypothetical protein